MITNATVTQVLTDKIAVVEAARKSACDGCHKQTNGESCSVCTLLGGDRKITAKANNKIGAKVGDRVEIESSSGLLLLYGVIIFVLPIIAALAAYYAAQAFGADETIRLIAALVGFLIITAVDIFVSRIIGKSRCDVNIVKIINSDTDI